MKIIIKLLMVSLVLLLWATSCSFPYKAGNTTAPKIQKASTYKELVDLPPLKEIRPDRCMISLKAWEEDYPEPKTGHSADLTARNNLGILVVGDSLSVGIGAAVADLLKKNKEISVTQGGKISSGLNTPKFYNWEVKFREFIEKARPRTAIIMIGGNDAHNGSGSETWAEDYGKKVSRFIKIAKEYDVQVYWAGLPPMSSPDFTKKVKLANSVIESICSSSGNCTYIDTWPIAAGDDDDFTKHKNIQGKVILLRSGDGIHFTFTGYKVLSRHILAQMQEVVGQDL